MISKIARKISAQLVSTHAISESDFSLYEYGIFILLSKVLFFLVSIVFAYFLHMTWNGIAFFVSFFLIRSYAGGIHATTETQCAWISTFSIFICECIIKCYVIHDSFLVPWVLLLLCSVIISVISPLDTQQKPLSSTEAKKYKRITVLLVVLTNLLAFFLSTHNRKMLLYSFSVAYSFESILLLAGVQKRKPGKNI